MDRNNMKRWLEDYMDSPRKKPIPVLSFPCVSLLNTTVRQLTCDSRLQARGMEAVAARVPSGASVSMMDLSVEAEAFGAPVRMEDWEVPTVTGPVAPDEDAAKALPIPRVGQGRTGIYLEAVSLAAARITDRPVFAGMIGPFSLAGRLMGVSEALYNCYDEPDLVKRLLDKATAFLMEYAAAYKQAGASGILLAEPLTGLLSPALAEEFSHPYVEAIIRRAQDDGFLMIYHNCGGSAVNMTDALVKTGASALHFGNSADMSRVLSLVDQGLPVMGNIDPAGVLRNGSPETVYAQTTELLARCGGHPNFILSSGCDIPPATPWENIDAFFAAAAAFGQ